MERRETTSAVNPRATHYRPGIVWTAVKAIRSQLVIKQVFINMLPVGKPTKEIFDQLTERYKASIEDVNQKTVFAVSFAFIALYVYFVLPETEAVKIPFTDVSVSREIWIGVAPAISCALAILTITSFLWWMTLRAGIKFWVRRARELAKSGLLDIKEGNPEEPFPDLTNLLLKGTLGSMWMLFRIPGVLSSRWNYVWTIPLLVLLILVALSPALISWFFTYLLFQTGYLVLGVVYVAIFIPVSVLSLFLLGTAGLAGLSDTF